MAARCRSCAQLVCGSRISSYSTDRLKTILLCNRNVISLGFPNIAPICNGNVYTASNLRLRGRLSLLNSTINLVSASLDQRHVAHVGIDNVSSGNISVSSDTLGAPLVHINGIADFSGGRGGPSDGAGAGDNDAVRNSARDKVAVVGSISHKDGVVVSVAMENKHFDGECHAVGIDIEDLHRNFLVSDKVESETTASIGLRACGSRLQRFCGKILTEGELAHYSRYLTIGTGHKHTDLDVAVPLALLLFSLKESVYKALHPLLPVNLRRYVHFKEVEVWLDGNMVRDLLMSVATDEKLSHNSCVREDKINRRCSSQGFPSSLDQFESARECRNIPVEITLLLPELDHPSLHPYSFCIDACFTRYLDKYWISCVHIMHRTA